MKVRQCHDTAPIDIGGWTAALGASLAVVAVPVAFVSLTTTKILFAVAMALAVPPTITAAVATRRAARELAAVAAEVGR